MTYRLIKTETGCGKAKQELIRMMKVNVRQTPWVDLTKVYGMTANNIRDFKLEQQPSISLDKLIKHLRDFGSTVTITVDGLVMPVGD